MKFSLEKGMLYYLLGQISLGHTQELFPLNLSYSCKIENKWSPGSRYAMKEYSCYCCMRSILSLKRADYYTKKYLCKKKKKEYTL